MFDVWPSVMHSAVLSLGSRIPGLTATSSSCKEINDLKSISGGVRKLAGAIRVVKIRQQSCKNRHTSCTCGSAVTQRCIIVN